MKYLNKLASVFFAAALGMLTLTSCEGGDLFNVNAPDWLSEMGGGEEEPEPQEELEGQMEDVYNIGNADLTAGFFTLGKTYVVPAGQKWQAQFNLTVNPDNKYYKNFYLVLNLFADNAVAGEYGVIRFDNDPSKNSEWNTKSDVNPNENELDRSLVSGNFTNSSDSEETDASVQKMNGKITITVDRSNGGLFIKMTNGTLTKTYTQTTPFPSTGSDVDIACRIGVEQSLVSFLSTNIVPIGGCTEAGDKEPVSMVLKGVPAKVLQGTDFETLAANVTAEVTFDGLPSPVTVKSEDLKLEAIPDMNSLGTKTLVAAYSKTYKGEGAAKPVIAYATFNVVDKMYTLLGAADNSSAWWSAHSEKIKVAPKETLVTTFTNYTSGANAWNNFCTVLTNSDGSVEYGVLRADNWGWGTGWSAEGGGWRCTPSGGQSDWATWLAAMNGAKVTLYVTNNGDGTCDVKSVMKGTDGVEYKQDYIGLNTVTDPNDFYFHLTIDNCHLEFDDILGADDNSSIWWSEHSPYIKVPVGQTITRRFRNYTSGGGNWNNFCTVLTNSDGSIEYGVLRADNWGWGTGWSAEGGGWRCTPSGGQSDWPTWLAAMDDAMVTVSVTNNGNGTADVHCVMVGNDGVTYTQDYTGLDTVTNPDDLYFHLTIDACHLVFE